ncbi:ATP phosphoribosyltransferase [Candidatus Peregrinibacteria bacterium]|nr:MAG: ATP phosphoribosyltransferase [Candidatus Peregrinibacteria bacterium]
MNTVFRLAIQKSGRMGSVSQELLRKAGFDFHCDERGLLARVHSFPLEILFLRVGDIPEMIADKVVDFGILGKNTIAESPRNSEIKIIDDLKFSSCRLSIAVPNDSAIVSPADLSGKTIATSYERLLGGYLMKEKLSATIVPMSGSVEISPKMGISDAICDLVSSGSTLVANHLREVESIFFSSAVLATQKDFLENEVFEEFLLRIRSVANAKNLKSVVMNAPRSSIKRISEILPGLGSPTVTSLAEKGWVAIHSVVREDEDFWKKITRLKEAGASGILVSSIDRIIF